MTEAESPTVLSAPCFSKISLSIAVEPLPDNGLTIRSGASSGGIFTAFRMGEIREVIISEAPLALKRETAVMIITRVGISENAPPSPSLAPSRKGV